MDCKHVNVELTDGDYEWCNDCEQYLDAVPMDAMAELASAIVERQWYKHHRTHHSFTDKNGDLRYNEEVQDEFIKVLDIIDDVLNGTRSR